MNKCTERVYNGLIKENPTFVLMLGMCPTLAVTTSAINGLGMGLSTTVVLVLSNMLISMLRKVIPDSVRMPAFIVVVASFVTIVQFLLEGFVPSLYDSLGLYIPLIVVNCIILGRQKVMHLRTRYFHLSSMVLVWDLDLHLVLPVSRSFVSLSEPELSSVFRFFHLQTQQQEKADMYQ